MYCRVLRCIVESFTLFKSCVQSVMDLRHFSYKRAAVLRIALP